MPPMQVQTLLWWESCKVDHCNWRIISNLFQQYHQKWWMAVCPSSQSRDQHQKQSPSSFEINMRHDFTWLAISLIAFNKLDKQALSAKPWPAFVEKKLPQDQLFFMLILYGCRILVLYYDTLMSYVKTKKSSKCQGCLGYRQPTLYSSTPVIKKCGLIMKRA